MGKEELPTVTEVRTRINKMDTQIRHGKIYQNAFRFLYLTAGNISEVTGKYAPLGSDAITTDIAEEEAVIFPIKTARRKGRIRPVALPLDYKYEPWSKILLNWFSVHENAHPFGGLSMRAVQRISSQIFQGLMWPVEQYDKVIRERVDDSKIIRERGKSEGTMEYLVEYDDYTRRWVEDPTVMVKTETQPQHWRPFSLISLRHQRIRELKYFYGFTDEQMRIYTGLTSQNSDSRVYSVLDRYDWVNPSDDAPTIEALRFAASSYFKNLLKITTIKYV